MKVFDRYANENSVISYAICWNETAKMFINLLYVG